MSRITSMAAIGLTLLAGAASAAASTPTPPDWSGTWVNSTGLYFSNPGTFRPLQNAGQGTNLPPLKPEFEKRWRDTMAASARGEPTKDAGAECGWPGVPAGNLSPMPHEFLITRDRVGILSEYTGGFRLVYMDGRKLPEDFELSYNGFSTGRWEGDTLVIDTVGLRGDYQLELSGIEHTEQLTVRERIRKVGPDLMENEITMTDPGAFIKPWKATVQFRRMPPDEPGSRMIEYVCQDNNRNGVGADGTTYTLGPDGKPLHGPEK